MKPCQIHHCWPKMKDISHAIPVPLLDSKIAKPFIPATVECLQQSNKKVEFDLLYLTNKILRVT